MSNHIPVKFSAIRLEWCTGRTVSTLTMHHVTQEDALRRATYFGYKEPKWYQFWRKKISISIVV